jgi:hypothetical protein
VGFELDGTKYSARGAFERCARASQTWLGGDCTEAASAMATATLGGGRSVPVTRAAVFPTRGLPIFVSRREKFRVGHRFTHQNPRKFMRRRARASGRRLAAGTGMAIRHSLDREPGPVPEIRAVGDSVVFHMAVRDAAAGARLTIRCNPDGSVWVSIQTDEQER